MGVEDTKTRMAPGPTGPSRPPAPASWPVPYTLGSGAFNLVALALIALLVLPYAMAYVEGWEKHGYLKSLMGTQARVSDAMGGWLHRCVPTHLGGADRTQWILVGGLFIAWVFFGRLSGRLGARAEYLYMDDSVPLQEVSDRVIDIAGHMQKYADPNTVAVAKNVVEPTSQRHGFQDTKKVVDGYQVLAWRAGDAE